LISKRESGQSAMKVISKTGKNLALELNEERITFIEVNF
jgi:hypothetical protein